MGKEDKNRKLLAILPLVDFRYWDTEKWPNGPEVLDVDDIMSGNDGPIGDDELWKGWDEQ